jgi:CelD/BcsL family acetyltransferase involved in cellulose biosynthesis
MAAERPDSMRFDPGVADRATTAPARSDTRERTLRQEWDALADRVAAPPFVRPGWVEAWHRSYGAGELELLSVRDGAELIGVLPLDVSPRLTASPTNTHTPFFGPVADGRDAERLLAWELIQRTPRQLRLDHLDPGSTWFAALDEALREAGWHAIVDTVGRPPYVRTAGDWDAYRKTLSKNLVKQIGRRRRRLEETGSVTVEVHATETGLATAMRHFVAVEASGWKVEQGTAIASRAESVRFYEDLAAWAAGRGALGIAFLRHEGRVIAAELTLEEGGVVYSLKGGFDPDYRKFGPGQLLTFATLERAFAGDTRSYELLGNDDDYKLSWTDRTRERVRLEGLPPGVRGAARHLARRHVRPIRTRLRRR